MNGPVAVLTAAASRAGTRITFRLVDDGWDIALWETMSMLARGREVAARGRRAAVVRGDIGEPASVRLMAATTSAVFETVDAVVHLDARQLGLDGDGSDPATETLISMGAVVVVYVAPPTWDSVPTQAWCAILGVEAHVLDATRKVHDLAPAVRQLLSR